MGCGGELKGKDERDWERKEGMTREKNRRKNKSISGYVSVYLSSPVSLSLYFHVEYFDIKCMDKGGCPITVSLEFEFIKHHV